MAETRFPVARTEIVKRRVAALYGVTVEDMEGRNGTKLLAWPRHVAMYIAVKGGWESMVTVGARFDRRDHSTVKHAVDKISRLISNDEKIAAEIVRATEISLSKNAESAIADMAFEVANKIHRGLQQRLAHVLTMSDLEVADRFLMFVTQNEPDNDGA